MPAQDLHQRPFEESTVTKLEIFEQYLTAWLPTFLFSRNSQAITICDFFAGPGHDINQTPGSPLRILKALEKYEDLITQTERFCI